MRIQTKIDKAKDAIDDICCDTQIPLAEIQDVLEELRDLIEQSIEDVERDIQDPGGDINIRQ